MANELEDLIESPRENLEIELKEWLDLRDPIARANAARHLAALANHGGGYIVFGFKDDLSPDPKRPSSLDDYNRDAFASITKRYLTPNFQCESVIVKNNKHDNFVVVRVPGHGSSPIAARADGPQDNKGRPQGIVAGTYYIRKPGPESAPIIGAEEWAALIRRCVLNDRDSLLNDIAALVQKPQQVAPDTTEQLARWHTEGEQRFLRILSQTKLQWPVPLERNHYQLSYQISTSDREAISEDSLRQALEEVNNEVRNTVWTGWSMFYPFTRPEIAPAFFPEQPDGTGPDVLEASLLEDRDFDTSLPDFWRVSTDGRVTLVRAYREDRQRSVSGLGRPAGTWLSPETVVRETAELVTHSRLLARRFETASHISFRCTWMGLRERTIADFDPAIYWSPGHIAKADVRTTEGDWTTAQLAAWPSVVADLACPVLRLFGLTYCGPEFVEGMKSRFIKL